MRSKRNNKTKLPKHMQNKHNTVPVKTGKTVLDLFAMLYTTSMFQ
jgi:hypothetical protein